MKKTSIPSANDVPRIPGYELLEPIGAGGMGIVFRARQFQPARFVAIKYLLQLPSDQSGILSRRYQRESQLMASLHHPNIVAMYDCGKLLGQFYIIMEYVAGTTLRALMQPDVPWPLAQAVPILSTLAHALTYIHHQDVLHLDFKPENILCDESGGALKITDFGLALLQKLNARSLLGPAWNQGTIDYAPPEQRFGLAVDERSDLFALAAVAYELLSGHVPGRVYYPCVNVQPQLPAAVDEVLQRALAREPNERFATVEDFRHALMQASKRSPARTL